MIEDPRISRALRYLTYTVLAGLVIFGVYALLNRPPDLSNLSDADIEATVVAEVADRLEGTPTRAVTPDVTASIEARLTQVALGTPLPTAAASATATPAPSLVPVLVEDSPGGVIGFVTGLLTGIWGLITGLWGIIQGLWNFFAFGGAVLQSLCCIILPVVILVALFREGTL